MSEAVPATVSSRFSSESADVVIRSQDGVLFKVHSKNLDVHSEGLLLPSFSRVEDSTIDVTELASTLDLLFQFMYHQRQPNLRLIDFEVLLRLTEAAEKYKVYSAMDICSLMMMEHGGQHALAVFNYGMLYGYEDVAKSAVFGTLDTSPKDAAASLSRTALKPWVEYYDAWIVAINAAVERASRSSCCDRSTCPDWVVVLSELRSSMLLQPCLIKNGTALRAKLRSKSGCSGCNKALESLCTGIYVPAQSDLILANKPRSLTRILAQKGDQLSTRFCAEDADVTFRSSDGVLFRVHRHNLELLSEAFAYGQDFASNVDDVISLVESSDVLDLLFQFMYRQRQPDLRKVEFSVLADVAEAAEKFQV